LRHVLDLPCPSGSMPAPFECPAALLQQRGRTRGTQIEKPHFCGLSVRT
jgi:hypothetical protein